MPLPCIKYFIIYVVILIIIVIFTVILVEDKDDRYYFSISLATHTNRLANEQEASKGKTALMVAIETENKELIQAVTCIEGMNLNLFDLEGNSCFHYASASCDPSIIKVMMMVIIGADDDDYDYRG